MTPKHRVVIIGNGIAGATVAEILGKKKDFVITMISDECNLPYARTALMYIFMDQVRWADTLLQSEDFWNQF